MGSGVKPVSDERIVVRLRSRQHIFFKNKKGSIQFCHFQISHLKQQKMKGSDPLGIVPVATVHPRQSPYRYRANSPTASMTRSLALGNAYLGHTELGAWEHCVNKLLIAL